MSIQPTLSNLINDIRVHKAILVIGAGASFEAGLPLYAQLAPIIWQVLDEFDEIKMQLCGDSKISAKQIIGQDIEKIKGAFHYIKNSPLADTKFKSLFAVLNDKHKSGNLYVHESICKLIHLGYVQLVVSFNWDDLIETAWESIYGININSSKRHLMKPHGDVRNISDAWIYPDSAGFLSAHDIEHINNPLSSGPATFIILGYSEQDSYIVNTFIKPNESKYTLYRISPAAFGDNSIPTTASNAMQIILSTLSQASKDIWIRVDYSNQIGLEHALMGYRLLPSDASACPRLPQITDAKNRLEQAHYVVIEGEPGSGKSITAYQIAFDYLNDGWEVLRLDTLKSTVENTPLVLEKNGYKTVYIIDDAQQISTEQVVCLMTKSGPKSKLIITQTITSNFPFETVTISQEQAIEVLYEYYLKHKDEIVPIILATNKTAGRYIGDNPLDTPFEFVLEVARREKTPWLFNYSVRGGWESTSSQYRLAREHKRADVLLALIALKQIITLDKPSSCEWLNLVLSRWGYSDEWYRDQINFLVCKKLLIRSDEIRTLHLQMAIRIVINFIKHADKTELQRYYTLMQNELLDESNPILGVAWFFNMLRDFEVEYLLRNNILSKELCSFLLNRCIKQTDSEAQSHAAYVIERVLNTIAGIKYEDMFNTDPFLTRWIENVNNITAYSFSLILNNMINESREWYGSFLGSLNAESIYKNIKNISSEWLYDWAHFLNRLVYSQKSKWVIKFCNHIPKFEIGVALQECSTSNIGGLAEMLCTLSYIDRKYCFEKFHQCLGIIKKSMDEHFIRTLEDIDIHFLMIMFGENLFDLGHPDKKQIDAGKAFVSIISSEMITNCINNGNPRNWDTLSRYFDEILKYDPEKIHFALDQVSFSLVDEKAANLWTDQPDALIELIYMLNSHSKERTEEWIYSNKCRMSNIDPAIAQFSPRTAVFCLENGGHITLTKSHRWRTVASAISSLRKLNKKVCQDEIAYSLHDIEQSLSGLSQIDWEEYYLFLKQLLYANKELITKLINNLDMSLVEEKWIASIVAEQYIERKKDLLGFQKLLNIIELSPINQETIRSVSRLKEIISNQLLNLKPYN